jgi:hypothetical protein
MGRGRRGSRSQARSDQPMVDAAGRRRGGRDNVLASGRLPTASRVRSGFIVRDVNPTAMGRSASGALSVVAWDALAKQGGKCRTCSTMILRHQVIVKLFGRMKYYNNKAGDYKGRMERTSPGWTGFLEQRDGCRLI